MVGHNFCVCVCAHVDAMLFALAFKELRKAVVQIDVQLGILKMIPRPLGTVLKCEKSYNISPFIKVCI